MSFSDVDQNNDEADKVIEEALSDMWQRDQQLEKAGLVTTTTPAITTPRKTAKKPPVKPTRGKKVMSDPKILPTTNMTRGSRK